MLLLVKTIIWCIKITSDEWENVEALLCNHEEADTTRNMLHAKHISNYEYEGIVIVAYDTDVRRLAIAFSDHISIPIFQKCASQTRTIYINLTAVSQNIEYSLSKALLGLHGFTGCDTVSAFARKG